MHTHKSPFKAQPSKERLYLHIIKNNIIPSSRSELNGIQLCECKHNKAHHIRARATIEVCVRYIMGDFTVVGGSPASVADIKPLHNFHTIAEIILINWTSDIVPLNHLGIQYVYKQFPSILLSLFAFFKKKFLLGKIFK